MHKSLVPWCIDLLVSFQWFTSVVIFVTSSLISSADIFGIWFYDKDECARIGQLMNSLVQITLGSQKDLGSGKNTNILLNLVCKDHGE